MEGIADVYNLIVTYLNYRHVHTYLLSLNILNICDLKRDKTDPRVWPLGKSFNNRFSFVET